MKKKEKDALSVPATVRRVVKIVKVLAVVNPGCRLLLIVADALRDSVTGEVTTYADYYPVVAIETLQVDVFEQFGENDPDPDPTTSRQARQEGWQHRHCYIKRVAVVVHDEYGICNEDDFFSVNATTNTSVVAATWPESEDATRVARLLTEARNDVKRLASYRSRSYGDAITIAKNG